jgi:tRNA nucleotidyltransferase (CCA-adding enzyme)
MKTYLVGGAVRDKLLGLEFSDRDWLVVGATLDDMLDQGFKSVGQDFPVFLHPRSQEEYALARKERKMGKGYTGFACISDPSISLEDDLLRRDLTINAIAEDEDGTLHDPYGGIDDIKRKLLRHVSPAFSEDPLRVLRVARFAARFAYLGFSVADETMRLMRRISDSGELSSLKAERVFKETEKALRSKSPAVYFQVLRDCGALAVLFPEVDALFGVPQTATHHPEIDCGIHTLMVLEQAAILSDDTAVRFAALTHDLGKALSRKADLPKHHGHEVSGLKPVTALCQRLGVPNDYKALALLCCQYHLHSHRAFELKAATIAKLIKAADAYRRPERFSQFLLVCEADSKGRLGFEQRPYPQRDYLQRCFDNTKGISRDAIDHSNLSGPEIGQAIEQARIAAINLIKKQEPKHD